MIRSCLSLLWLFLIALWGIGWAGRFSTNFVPLSHNKVVRWVVVDDLPTELALHETVFWEPLDTVSLRKLLRETPLAHDKSVLEIGTGCGLLALCCWQADASHVVATDINPHAISCARQNAARLDADVEFRLVPSGPRADSGAFSVIGDDERFDLIISNPPWEDDAPAEWSDYALYDPNFVLLRSLLVGVKDHLTPGGKLLLAYGCVEAIEVTQRIAAERGLYVTILDKRNPSDLPHVFLPGMVVGVTPDEIPELSQPVR